VEAMRTTDDARFARMERLSVLYAQITSATREFLRAVAECDRHRDWAEEGFGCCADWLAWRIGMTRGTAREKVRAARALEELPLISEAMDRGEVSFSKVRAITRVASRESEAELLELARSASTATLERVARGWKAMSRAGERTAERVRHQLRRLSIRPDGDGMYELRGRLTPEVAAVLMRAVEAANDALYRAHSGPDEDRPEPEQLRADALGLLAERALAAGLADADAPVSGSRAERYQVVLHVEAETLEQDAEPGISELEDGTRVSAETSRRLACDATRTVVSKDRRGRVVGVGRKTRTIPPGLRRALEVRDRGCRFPGCGLRFADAHHIQHWADGGRTELRNTVLLCRRHHRLVHEEGHRIAMDREGRVAFFAPSGRAIAAAAPPSPLGVDPLAELVEANRRRGADPRWNTILPRRHRDAGAPWELEADAWHALDRAAELAEHRAAEHRAADPSTVDVPTSDLTTSDLAASDRTAADPQPSAPDPEASDASEAA